MSSKLIAHRGAVLVDRNSLRDVPTPPRTKTFTPIPHYVFVDRLLKSIKSAGLEVTREEYAVHKDMGNTLFGVFDLLDHNKPDYAPSFGFRTSNNRHMSLRGVAGLRVFVCDNLALSGEHIVMKRKHTSMLDIEYECDNAVAKFVQASGKLDTEVNEWKETEVPFRMGKAILFDMFAKRIMPPRLIPNVATEWEQPSYDEFTENGYTAWRLLNSVTTAARILGVGERNRTLVNFGTYFRELFSGGIAS